MENPLNAPAMDSSTIYTHSWYVKPLLWKGHRAAIPKHDLQVMSEDLYMLASRSSPPRESCQPMSYLSLRRLPFNGSCYK